MYVGGPPPPWGARRFGSMGEHLTRRGDLAGWPDQEAHLLFLVVSSLVRDILELKYCTKLFHQTVHALSARLCETRRNLGVSRGKHHSNKTAFSIAFFAAFSLHFPCIFSAFLPIPATAFPPPFAGGLPQGCFAYFRTPRY